MKDPKFCISYLMQLLFLFESFFKPVSTLQKKYFAIQEAEVPTKKRVNRSAKLSSAWKEFTEFLRGSKRVATKQSSRRPSSTFYSAKI